MTRELGNIRFLIEEKHLVGSDGITDGLVARYPTENWEALDQETRRAYGRQVFFEMKQRARRWAFQIYRPKRFSITANTGFCFPRSSIRRNLAFDAGIEQRALKALEVAPPGVDWTIVEDISRAAGRK